MPFPEETRTTKGIIHDHLREIDRLSDISFPLALREAKAVIQVLEQQIEHLSEWIANLDDRFSAHENQRGIAP